MGRHEEWRKVAKRERRRRNRTQKAKERDTTIACNSREYQDWLRRQEELEFFELEQIEKTNMEENIKWLKAERVAMKQWQRLQVQKEKYRIQHLEEEAKQRLEWEMEQERKRKEEERLKEIEEENKKKQEMFMMHLEKFLSGDSDNPPETLMVSRETKPYCNPCPFFSKTACCRFGDQCSRNHKYPGISKVLLATNFFSHFGLEKSDEHDADIMLEYEDSDTYKEFKDVFLDILPEFEKFGRVTLLKICNNYERHLRGNTYVEFAELRCAVAAYRALHTRWYGGKQLSLQFCLISSWKNAICGLQPRKKCPKGRACNFLHVFRNPNNLVNSVRDNEDHLERTLRTPSSRTWRWSESPEVEVSRTRRPRSRDRRERERKQRNSHSDSRRDKGSRRERYRRDSHDRSERRDESRCRRNERRGDMQREERHKQEKSIREKEDEKKQSDINKENNISDKDNQHSVKHKKIVEMRSHS